jgi:hypothetical protein
MKKLNISAETIIKYDNAIEYYLKVKSIIKTDEKFHVNRDRFSQYMKSKGIEIINYQNLELVDNTVFNKIDTEEKAYWLGFLYADGCVYKNRPRLELSLQKSDTSHLNKFKNFLKYEYPIIEDSFRCRLSINNKQIYNDLLKLGCIPNKSLILLYPTKEQLPEEYTIPFVRGYFDGDGSIITRKTRIGTEYLNLSLIGTSEFLNSLQKEMNWKFSKLYKDKRHKNNTFFLSYNGKYVLNMFDILYSNSNIHLDRKYDKYINFKNK